MNLESFFYNISSEVIEEQFDGFVLSITPGGIVYFDKNNPSNGLHSHKCFELCIILSGQGEYYHNGIDYTLSEGDIILSEPNAFHEIKLPKFQGSSKKLGLSLLYFLIKITSPADFQSMCDESLILKNFIQNHKIISSKGNYVMDFLNLMTKNVTQASPFYKYSSFQIRFLIFLCINALIPQDQVEDNHTITNNHIIERATIYIRSNMLNRPKISDIALYACTSSRNLQHLFKKHLNKTVVEFFNERKMNIAAGYLRMNFNITEVTSMLGYTDIAQFSRLFKKHYGIPPKKYQSQFISSGFVNEVENKS